MNHPSIEIKLKEILFDLIQDSDGCQYKTADAIDPAIEFSTLNITSIDLMEFVLVVEAAFDISVLDNLSPENLPTTLSQWADLTSTQLAVL
ncbi:hypothetical protein Poly24_37450 [Rosistilla carotiformis]|uniref:Acyl carrier protein n=1 Tax=Rosistilla carotiformis TaxID=2528017 RepID=A0A518JWY1_9BACT|nr:hypothetical protein [Rosistilla carotiformis]QDV70026.1 hypothetical protein Poly24_37450 [Rosistilla carotiformis]